MIPIGNGKMQLFDKGLPGNYPKELLNDTALKLCLDSLKQTNQLNPDLVILYLPSYLNHPIIKAAQAMPNPADLMTGICGINQVFKLFHRDHPAIQSLIGATLKNDIDLKNVPIFIWIISIDDQDIEWGYIPYILKAIGR
jgi:hypothetical protein